ncbi:aryl-sulfate sulfotransferase [Methylocapsa palsarum]|uniref:Arylsulfotransferase (ASST) n=1 Tax=Methylocapsa palsarum TaxID=1612308 RepID=A0A1I4CKH7_9HYPH|nr:aryl-sulfate sulfotransferase [Methylocapsa palsarum]SFK81792.1 Arylsulfotransferase (ASST) [Methylocapsa palsarum]
MISRAFAQRLTPRCARWLSRSAATLAFSQLALIAPVFDVSAEPSVYPTGVTRYDPAKAYNSFVIFSGPDKITRLIDLNGHVAREWKYAGFPSLFLDPALVGGARGRVLVTLSTVDANGVGVVPGRVNLDISKTIGEVDWDGKTVWEWGGGKAPGDAAQQHHDWRRLPNGNTLILANLVHPVAGFAQPQILDDVIYEIKPNGDIAWKWIASDHLEEFGFSPDELRLVRNAKTADYLHVNNLSVLGPNRWFDAGDKRFDPDNVLIDSRNANFTIIIDKKTGKIVWSLGPHYPTGDELTGGKKQIPRPVDQISGQHDAHLIAQGLPGAGNLLVFDNQGEGGYPPVPLAVTGGSRVLEIDPVKQEIVWEYTGESSGRPGWTFRSSFISSARRLPNGNTLIDEGANGRFFQVTPKGEIVWEYVSPYFGSFPNGPGGDQSNWVYRAQPVPYDWAPAGTPHSENPVAPPALAEFRAFAAP